VITATPRIMTAMTGAAAPARMIAPRIRTPLRIRIRTSRHGRHLVIGRALPFLYMIVLFGSLKIYSAGLRGSPQPAERLRHACRRGPVR
jgi:hypothetical protein